ncbi:unnamed protein product [Penicillium nalgiovense]|nr:unnamed protein product [Penicillium nalgiovense]CAG8203179.1 unnamed protein product [Penicillium nalgiovense]
MVIERVSLDPKACRTESEPLQSDYNSAPIVQSIPLLPDIQARSNRIDSRVTYSGIQLHDYQIPGPDTRNKLIANTLQPSLTNYPKYRMRVAKACDRCRSHKTKCTGTIPCSSCIKHGIQCDYSTYSYGNKKSSNSKSFIENIEGRKDDSKVSNPVNLNINSKPLLFHLPSCMPDIRKDEYIAELESKIKTLQSMPNLKLSNTPCLSKHPETEDRSSAFTMESSQNNWKYLCRHQTILTFKLFKSVYGNLSDKSKSHVSMPRLQGFGWNMSGGRYLTPEKLPSVPDFELSSTDFHIDFYFQGINSLFAILHEAVFREQVLSYNNSISEERRSFTVPTSDARVHETRLFQAQLYLVYALSIRFSEFHKKNSNCVEMLNLEEKLFKYAHKVIQILSFEWESFELIQGWLLITLYLRITHRLSSSFMALGNAISMTRAMGLGHRDPIIRNTTSYEHLKAKRIFWCVYTFDRLFSLQYGRYCGLLDAEIFRSNPVLCFQDEEDGWLTLPAFAMIHLARISNLINDLANDNLTGIDVQNCNKKLQDLETWFNDTEFNDDALFSNADRSNYLYNLAKVQVKLHYYDLIFYFHGRSVFCFLGENIELKHLDMQKVLDASKNLLQIFQKLKDVGLLDIPWYMTLLLIFNVGVYSATFINSGVFLIQSKENLSNSIKLISHLQGASIYGTSNIKMDEKFTMAKECVWALKMLNHMLFLRFQDNAKELMGIGIDHGSDEVNRQNFSRLGQIIDDNNKSIRKPCPIDNYKQFLSSNNLVNPLRGTDVAESDFVPLSMDSVEHNYDSLNQTENNILLENLRWFDQWLDFNNY